MEGFGSEGSAKCVIAVADKDVKSVDEAARLLVDSFVKIDETQKRIKFKIGPFLETESAEIVKNFAEGRHTAILKRLVEEEFLKSILGKDKFLLLAVDEADKCPDILARLVRSVSTHAQHKGVTRVSFVLAGVTPFFQKMVSEDAGVSRFFYRTILLKPMSLEDAGDLIETKLTKVADAAELQRISIEINPEVITKVVRLSGGHPHILQLLGSHLVIHEGEDPDGVIDSKDLLGALRQICFEDRAGVYDSILDTLDIYERTEELELLFTLAEKGFPTHINKRRALEELGEESIKWFMDHEVLAASDDDSYYGLVDEFLRIRLMLRDADSAGAQSNIERAVIRDVSNKWYL